MTDTGRVGALLLDHLDSFSRNVADALFECGFEPTVLTVSPGKKSVGVDPSLAAALRNCRALVLSPGPGHPRDYDTAGLRAYLRQERPDLPVLGVCLGLQMLLDWDDLPVAPLSGQRGPAVHGRIKPIGPPGLELPFPFQNIRATAGMVFYNSLAVHWSNATSAGPQNWHLVPSDDDEAFVTMAVHRELPWMGVQFHPESFASPDGTAVFRAFKRFCDAHRTMVKPGDHACSAASMLLPL